MQHDSSAAVPLPQQACGPIVGIDVSKAKLDCHIDPVGQRLSLANDEEGIARLIAHLRPLSVIKVVIEATARLRACEFLARFPDRRAL